MTGEYTIRDLAAIGGVLVFVTLWFLCLVYIAARLIPLGWNRSLQSLRKKQKQGRIE